LNEPLISSVAVAPRDGAPIWAIVPAGGVGSRIGAAIPKQYLELWCRDGKSVSVIEETVTVLLRCASIVKVIVVVAPDDAYAKKIFAELLKREKDKVELLFEGGATRRDSVLAGCRYVKKASVRNSSTWCLVHDAARPGVSEASIEAMIERLRGHPVGGLLAIPLADTVKQSLGNDSTVVSKTLDRAILWAAQTPQMFPVEMLVTALEANANVTDEASAVEALGLQPVLVPGEKQNFKITTPEDLAMMKAIKMLNPLSKSIPNIRIGQGFDSHAFVPGRPLILGGVCIPCERGLLGHSDADALLHAITDAVLGATGKGDIGRWFPDTSSEFAGADSAVLLTRVIKQIYAEGWLIGNVDATIIAQSPKLEPHMVAMVERIAQVLGIEVSRVNIKAKTNEKLGHLGRGEAIAVHAVAMLFKD
jgi:2-C-methyl-D-erythritol 4-phosphate cytidylyltransferase / 2-C-methyl-D-erythritol 2,4-cyclodiphosphate synthase